MSSSEAQLGGPSWSPRVPRFLLELDPWHRVFWRNLRDLLFWRSPRPLRLTSTPAPFWPDVFVSASVPWTQLRQSFLYHAFVITALWGFTQTYLLRPRVRIEPVTRNTTLTYYQVSEYLPPVFTGSAPAKVTKRGQPAYSKQPIISLPANPDNSRQTIVNPSAPKLITHAVKLPNLVVSIPAPQPPVAGATRSSSQLTLPWLAAAPVPPPEANTSRRLADLNLPGRAPSVVEPPPEASIQRKLGDINVAHAEPQVAAPKLPTPEQRASAGPGQETQSVPAPPSISVGGSDVQSAGQLIALGLDPAPASDPIEVPQGSRRGTFAATPEGKPGAPGTPDISAIGGGPGGTAKGGGAGGIGSGGSSGPAGIYVGAGPTSSTPAAVAGKTSPSTFADARRNVIIAAARPALDIPHEIPGTSAPRTPSPGTVEQEVFGPRKYYSMILNMPNLTSAGGSWIIRFTDLKQTPDQSDLTAPVAVHKVDPAYPSSLMKSRVEGTVTLYAIIRADGTVDGVKVLRGVDDALDEYARVALSHWQFRPATRHGAPVDLEAVVQIPFTARKLPF